MVQQPLVGQGLLIIEATRSHSDTPHIRQDSSGRVISPTQKSVPDNKQHSQETDTHAPGGIRTRSPSKRTAEDLRLRGCWVMNITRLKLYKTASKRSGSPNVVLRSSLSSFMVSRLGSSEAVVTNDRCLCWLLTMNRLKLQLDRPAAELSQDRHTDSPQIFAEERLVNGNAYWI
jgi:hypothetical protein